MITYEEFCKKSTFNEHDICEFMEVVTSLLGEEAVKKYIPCLHIDVKMAYQGEVLTPWYKIVVVFEKWNITTVSDFRPISEIRKIREDFWADCYVFARKFCTNRA